MSDALLRKNAYDLIDMLPATDVQKVIAFVLGLHNTVDNPYVPISEEQMLEDLAISRQQAAEGKIYDFDAAVDEINTELGLI